MPISVHDPRYQFLRQELARIRRAAGLTQSQLAQQLNVGQSYVSKIERGEAYVELLFFVGWCQACAVTPAVLLEQLAKVEKPTLPVIA